jgi:hypothetical protein
MSCSCNNSLYHDVALYIKCISKQKVVGVHHEHKASWSTLDLAGCGDSQRLRQHTSTQSGFGGFAGYAARRCVVC